MFQTPSAQNSIAISIFQSCFMGREA